MKWLERNWPASTIFLAIYTTIILVLFVWDDYPLFLIWVQLPIYFLHQFEEYVFPGGFVRWFNPKVLGSPRAEWPLTPTISMWINIPIIFVAFPLGGILATEVNLNYGVWMAYFSVVNSFSHVAMLFVFRGYNPGVAVSLSLNIPIGIYTIIYLTSNNLITASANITGLSIGLAVQAGVMIYGFAILKPRIRAANDEGDPKDQNLQ